MRHVVVFGSVNRDLRISVEQLPGRGETVLSDGAESFLGGKGLNQAIAAARLGAPTRLIACVGSDRAALDIENALDGEGVDRRGVRRSDGHETGLAVVVVERAGENQIVVVPGANSMLAASDVDSVEIGQDDVVVVQLEIPIETVAAVLGHARTAGATAILNAAPAHPRTHELLGDVDVLVVNEPELEALDGSAVAPDLTVVVTLGARGAVVHADGRAVTVPATTVDPVDTTGAGDCFVGALATALLEGRPVVGAARFGCDAAAAAVQRLGAATSMPRRHELPQPPAGASSSRARS